MRIPSRLTRSALTLSLQLWTLAGLVEGLKFTVDDWTVITGVPFDVSWTGQASGTTITLSLQNNTLANPQFVGNINTAISSNAYTWTPGVKALVGQAYFLEIAQNNGGSTALGSIFTVLASAPSSTSTSTSTSSTASGQTTTTGSSSTSATQTGPAATSSAASSGLSTGAKAGIGVGAAIGAIAIIAALAFFILRRRKVAKTRSTTVPQELGGNDVMAQTPQEKQNYVVPQTQSGPPAEMQGTVARTPEMEGSPGMRAEMPA